MAQEPLDTLADGLMALGDGALLTDHENFPAGTSVCDWMAMALAVSGYAGDYASYEAALRAYVEQAYAQNGCLDAVKATTCHRIALTVLALGSDPTAFGARPDGSPIDLIADGTYAFPGESLGAQGLNGWIYALLTLDASAVAVPADAKFTREDMVQAILDAQEPDGGFGLTPGRSNVDLTAMAVQALAPYASSCKTQLDTALSYLSAQMNADGRFRSYGAESAESSAQVLLALCALELDADKTAAFSRGQDALLSGLSVFRQADGSYAHTPDDGEGNFLATAQVLLALTALQRQQNGEGWLFDFSGYTGPAQKSAGFSFLWPAVCVGAAACVLCIILIRKKNRHGKQNQ